MFTSEFASGSVVQSHGARHDTLEGAREAFRIGSRPFHVSRASGTYDAMQPDVRVSVEVDGRPCWFWVPAGLLAMVLSGNGMRVEEFSALQPEDAALVVEHLIEPQLAGFEQDLGATIYLSKVEFLTSSRDDQIETDSCFAGAGMVLTCSDAAFYCQSVVPQTSVLTKALAAFAATPGSKPVADSPNASQPSQLALGTVLIGPVDVPAQMLDRLEPQDLLMLSAEGTISGGLMTTRGLIPMAIGDGQMSVLSAFRSSGETSADASQIKLWIEIGTARAVRQTLLPQQSLAFATHADNRAWLTADGSWERLAEGDLVDADGSAALRITAISTGV